MQPSFRCGTETSASMNWAVHARKFSGKDGLESATVRSSRQCFLLLLAVCPGTSDFEEATAGSLWSTWGPKRCSTPASTMKQYPTFC